MKDEALELAADLLKDHLSTRELWDVVSLALGFEQIEKIGATALDGLGEPDYCRLVGAFTVGLALARHLGGK